LPGSLPPVCSAHHHVDVAHCEQRIRSLRSGTVVSGAISLGQPRVGLDLVATPHDQPQMHRGGIA
jgi:hypothetical protein